MIDLGVPSEKIYLEEKASNTGENILFSKKSLNNMAYHIVKVC
jgi:uncharacterized SAM-binding protein YcdF (DUF218 family)